MIGCYAVISGVIGLPVCLAVYQCCHIQCCGIMICVYLLVIIWLGDQLSHLVRLVYKVFKWLLHC